MFKIFLSCTAVKQNIDKKKTKTANNNMENIAAWS